MGIGGDGICTRNDEVLGRKQVRHEAANSTENSKFSTWGGEQPWESEGKRARQMGSAPLSSLNLPEVQQLLSRYWENKALNSFRNPCLHIYGWKPGVLVHSQRATKSKENFSATKQVEKQYFCLWRAPKAQLSSFRKPTNWRKCQHLTGRSDSSWLHLLQIFPFGSRRTKSKRIFNQNQLVQETASEA